MRNLVSRLSSLVTLSVLLAVAGLPSSVSGQILSLPANPQFQNVYLRNATGCVDWDSGDITLCKTAANTLTLAGGQLALPAGSAAAPSVTFGDSNSGIMGFTNQVVLVSDGGAVLTAHTGFITLAVNFNLAGGIFFDYDDAARLQLGQDSAAPIAQMLKGPDATGGGPTAGASLSLQGGTPAGAGAYGDLILQSAGGNIVWTPTQAAGALLGTLTNSVRAGDPTIWLKVKVGATFYAVPGWTIP